MIVTIDLETKTRGLPNADHDEIQLVGMKDLDKKAVIYRWPRDKEKISAHLQRATVLVGYNLKGYDIPILQRYGLIGYRHVIIDLMQCVKRREAVLPFTFHSYALKNVLEVIGLNYKTELPKDTFQKQQDDWTPEETMESYEYLQNDLKIEEELYLYLNNYFKGWIPFLNADDQRKHCHLMSTNGSYTYKVICHAAGLKETYNDTLPEIGTHYEGGLVTAPHKEEAHGDIICLDFASMYPHAFFQGNLYSNNCSCCTKEEKWRGDGFFSLEGAYCSKQRGKIEQVILDLFKKRLEYKKAGDDRQYAIKIVINTMYGIAGNPVFKNVYNLSTVSDCTSIARQCLLHAREELKKEGLTVLYSDTDSCYVELLPGQKSRLDAIIKRIIDEIQSHFPFPSNTFDFKIDEEIKNIWFFKRNNVYKKKHYAYVTTNEEVVIKGLPIIKRDRSKLGKMILTQHLKPMMKQGKLKKTISEWETIIEQYVNDDLSVVGKHFYLKPQTQYKDPRCLSALLSKQYGTGRIFLIPNKRIGIGKSTRYCTIEEYQSKALGAKMIIMNKTYAELREFTEGVWNKSKAVTSKDKGQHLLWDF